ncbi:hypothetical protein evm_015318, partial [Chilo suppressalis]
MTALNLNYNSIPQISNEFPAASSDESEGLQEELLSVQSTKRQREGMLRGSNVLASSSNSPHYGQRAAAADREQRSGQAGQASEGSARR